MSMRACVRVSVCVGHYPVSSIMQPGHVSTQPHSSAADGKKRAEEQWRDWRENDEIAHSRKIGITEWVFKSFQYNNQKYSFTSLIENLLCCIKPVQFWDRKFFYLMVKIQVWSLTQLSLSPGRYIPIEISASPHLSVLERMIVDERQFVLV